MITVRAYAKINLHLDVTAKRKDGFHDVQNVMQSVSLCDIVTVDAISEKDIIIECNKPDVPTGENNIAFKAANLFFEKSGICGGAKIFIEKHIPMAAGLAGGSADAAGALIALNRIFGEPFDLNGLCEIGRKLGADVPFCIAGGCFYSDGKGDVLHDFPKTPENAIFVVACGGEGVSTPWAYKLLDENNNDFKGYISHGTEKLREALLDGGEEYKKCIFNLFEKSVLPCRPIACEIKETMLINGADNAMMSGSGPSVYGIFSTVEQAKTAEKAIIEKGYFAAVCTPIYTVYGQ